MFKDFVASANWMKHMVEVTQVWNKSNLAIVNQVAYAAIETLGSDALWVSRSGVATSQLQQCVDIKKSVFPWCSTCDSTWTSVCLHILFCFYSPTVVNNHFHILHWNKTEHKAQMMTNL